MVALCAGDQDGSTFFDKVPGAGGVQTGSADLNLAGGTQRGDSDAFLADPVILLAVFGSCLCFLQHQMASAEPAVHGTAVGEEDGQPDQQQNPKQGEQRRAIFELNKVIDDNKVTDSPLAYAYYLRGRAYYERNMDTQALDDFASAERTPHNNSIYPLWRVNYYQGLIYSDRQQWEQAYWELEQAWEECGHSDKEVESAMLRARRHAYPEQYSDRRPSSRGGSHSGNGEVDWGKVVSDVLTGILREG